MQRYGEKLVFLQDMNDRKVIWDPLRKKEVALTPEEKVRQWCIGVLSQQCKVPLHMMMSETGFKLGEKQFRADLVVYDRQARPVAVTASWAGAPGPMPPSCPKAATTSWKWMWN